MRLFLAFPFSELCPLWLKLGKLGNLIRSGRQLPLPRVRHHLTKFHFLAASQSLLGGEAESVPFHKVRRRKCNAGASRDSAGFNWTTTCNDLRLCIPTHDSLVIGRTGCTLATHSLHSCPKGGATYESPCFRPHDWRLLQEHAFTTVALCDQQFPFVQFPKSSRFVMIQDYRMQ